MPGMTPAVAARVRGPYDAARRACGIVKDYDFDLHYPTHRVSWRDKRKCSLVLLFIEHLVCRADAVAEADKDIDLDTVRNREYVARAAHKTRFFRVLQRLALYDRCAGREIEIGEEYP